MSSEAVEISSEASSDPQESVRDSAAPQPMESQPQQQPHEHDSKPNAVSFSIWPPTQRTRDAVINRLIETLSTPSVLSRRYGVVPHEEASALARQIEEDAFTAAGGSSAAEDDGIEILQVYSKEISKRMLDTVKSRPNTASATTDNVSTQTPDTEPIHPSDTTEAVPSANNET